MLGSVIGNLHGSAFIGSSSPSRELPPLTENNKLASDTVCTIAVVDHLLHNQPLDASFRYWVGQYPDVEYSKAFEAWAVGKLPTAASSWASSALAQTAPVVLLAENLEAALLTAKTIAETTHPSPIVQVAVARYVHLLWLAREGASCSDLLGAWSSFGGELHCVDAMHGKGFSRQVPADQMLENALSCLVGSESFDELMGTCLYHGGDSATLAAVAGPLGELLWGIPPVHVQVLRAHIDAPRLAILEALYEAACERA